jgi:hypothetical protein
MEIIEDKYKLNPEKWIRDIDIENIEDKYKLNPEKWIPNKKKNINFNKKYTLVISCFIFGLILVSVIKNETRKLQKEISSLEFSLNSIKITLHEANLDYQYLSSPDNIDKLAKKYLDTDFTFYEKSQIVPLNEKKEISMKPVNNKSISNKIILKMTKKIETKKDELKKIKKIYSNPNDLPIIIKNEMTRKIETNKNKIKKVYYEPGETISDKKVQRWAAVQVIKAVLGIPIVPGK